VGWSFQFARDGDAMLGAAAFRSEVVCFLFCGAIVKDDLCACLDE
jgi:hypothetical protein